jgi:hypothetical protein
MLLNRDIFFMSLTKAVSDWYDEHYFADKGELEGKKAFHLQTMNEHYNHWRFIVCGNLNEERAKFLGEVQVLVDNTYKNY